MCEIIEILRPAQNDKVGNLIPNEPLVIRRVLRGFFQPSTIHFLQARIQRLAQTIAKKIETQYRDKNRQTGEQGQPRRLCHEVPAEAEHGPP